MWGHISLTNTVVHGSLLHQQYAGEITVKALGIDVAVFDESGKHCLDGDTGDLVIKRPFPNSAVRFWNDDDFSKYRASYFTTFPGMLTIPV
jgi:acetoacetyl-CoA synthetase